MMRASVGYILQLQVSGLVVLVLLISISIQVKMWNQITGIPQQIAKARVCKYVCLDTRPRDAAQWHNVQGSVDNWANLPPSSIVAGHNVAC